MLNISSKKKSLDSDIAVSLNWPGKTILGDLSCIEGLKDKQSFIIGSPAQLGDGNSLVHANNLEFMFHFLDQLKNKIKLVYIDPPFNADQSFFTSDKLKSDKLKKGKSVDKREIAYHDAWSSDGSTYLQFLWLRLQLIHQLLSDDGSLYVHCDYRASAYIKLMLDEIFGIENYVNECIWSYRTGGNSKKLGYAKKHDTIHFVAKNKSNTLWNGLSEKSYLSHKYGFKNINLAEDENGIYNLVAMRDVWDIAALRGNQSERVNYPTQKPESLLERIILASTIQEDLVADFFCGSGTTGVVSSKLGRRWLLVDSSKVAIKVTKERLDFKAVL